MLFCSIALLACGQKNGEYFINEDATHTTRVVYKDGVRTLKERLLKTDTGYAKDGIREEIFDDGTKQVEYYKVGHPDSLILVYDALGVLNSKVLLYEGGIIGPTHRYFSNGRLEAFLWFTMPAYPGKANLPKWSLIRDSSGKNISELGQPIVHTLMSDRETQTSDSVTLSFFFSPSPDSMHTIFLVRTQRLKESKIDTFSSFIELPPMKMMILKKRYPFYKDARYSGVFLLLDNKDRIVVSDTAAVEK
ncbi:MAG: hypothetical protein KF744_11570 [Taibaiella sp.]|nr:hypothetical protein [Taibaiella sp.]